MKEVDYLIVGSGLTGATIARSLFDKGFDVCIVDRRSHLGGNVFDHLHESGIRIHSYGPHYFRTRSEEIWNFVNRFSNFFKFEAIVKSYVEEKFENWPLTENYIKNNIGTNWSPSFSGTPQNFEQACLSMMPEKIYNLFIKEYNIKQWGVDPKLLSKFLIKRFDVRNNEDPRLMPNHIYQGLPVEGYSCLMQNMIKDIPFILNMDYLKNRDLFKVKKKIIFTGPIDEFYDFKFGKLKYRGQERKHNFIESLNYKFPCGQINFPLLKDGPQIRILEWKHMMEKKNADKINGTVLTSEVTTTPSNPDNFEYPFPDEENKLLYNIYYNHSLNDNEVLICGRLGEYKYYDMDQAIGRALMLVKNKIL